MSGPLNPPLERLRRRKGAKWTLYEPEILPAWVADMDYPVADAIRDAVLGVVERDDYGYPLHRPPDDLASAFVERMRERFGWEVDRSGVLPVTELIQAIAAAVWVFSDPGDGVVIQTPIYPPFLQIVEKAGRRLVDNRLLRGPLRDELDLDALRAQLDPRTRILLFCNPHNPTGRVFSRQELESLAELALEHELVVISDEVHADLVYHGAHHTPFASLGPEIAARTLTLSSATKAFNIAGLRCAVMHFGGPELERCFRQKLPPQILGSPSVVGIDATIAAWRAAQPWLDSVIAQLDRNRAYVADFLAERLPSVDYRVPEATYFAWLDCTALGLPGHASRFFLKSAKVALSDGRDFSSYTADFVRLNFATSPAILDALLERMAAAVAECG